MPFRGELAKWKNQGWSRCTPCAKCNLDFGSAVYNHRWGLCGADRVPGAISRRYCSTSKHPLRRGRDFWFCQIPPQPKRRRSATTSFRQVRFPWHCWQRLSPQRGRDLWTARQLDANRIPPLQSAPRSSHQTRSSRGSFPQVGSLHLRTMHSHSRYHNSPRLALRPVQRLSCRFYCLH